MKLIKRCLENTVKKYMFKGKAIFIFGARQVGKTTLIKQITKSINKKTKIFNGDALSDRQILIPKSIKYLKNLTNDAEIIVIDEAHKFTEIDNTIKLLVDNCKEKQIIVSGSSSFILKSRTSDSLAGRKLTFMLYPLSFKELADFQGFDQELRHIEERLIFGSYPEIVLSAEKKLIINDIRESYLFKDILEWDGIRKSEKIVKLLTAIALQIGSQVSYRELAQIVGLDTSTVEKYIDILEQSFIIFRLPSFSKNLRNELKFSRKIYFWDLGIRNSLINNFNPTELRNDIGEIWENYIVAEIIKYKYYKKQDCRFYFWRTQQSQEIDLIEICGNNFNAYQIKWNPKQKPKFHKTFIKNYPEANLYLINSENFWEFIS